LFALRSRSVKAIWWKNVIDICVGLVRIKNGMGKLKRKLKIQRCPEVDIFYRAFVLNQEK